MKRPVSVAAFLHVSNDSTFENDCLHEVSHVSVNDIGYLSNKVGREKNLCEDWTKKCTDMNKVVWLNLLISLQCVFKECEHLAETPHPFEDAVVFEWDLIQLP